MKRTEALAEARRRWGRFAYVRDGKGRISCLVMPGDNRQGGIGPTFEAAFADADRRDARCRRAAVQS